MNRRCIRWLLFAAGFAMLSIASAKAAPPWNALIPFKRVDADPNKSYVLRESDGPWLVLATSFTGEGAKRQAQKLVLELRKKYKLTAYWHHQQTDHSEAVQGLGVDARGRPKRMRYLNAPESIEIAVLVGNYDSHDDSKAQKALKKIKYIRPDSLRVGSDGKTWQTLGLFREAQRLLHPKEYKERKGFMRTAFITRNPLLPEEYFVSKGLDPLVVKINQDAEFSLLKCSGAYTVKVATFRGATTMILSEIDRLERGGGMNSLLAEAAIKSHDLALALRRLGYEAYEFHDRHESIVTVGSFATKGHTLADGKIEINPEVLRVMQAFSAQPHNSPGQRNSLQPRIVDSISLDVQPIPIPVPRESIGGNYVRRTLFR